MIDPTEAQTIHDDLIRELHKRLSRVDCQACGATAVTAAEMNVLRQMLKDNEFQGIGAGVPVHKMEAVSTVPFPTSRAAHQ